MKQIAIVLEDLAVTDGLTGAFFAQVLEVMEGIDSLNFVELAMLIDLFKVRRGTPGTASWMRGGRRCSLAERCLFLAIISNTVVATSDYTTS